MKSSMIAYEIMREKAVNRAASHAKRGSDPEGFMEQFQASMAALRADVGGNMEAPIATESVILTHDPVVLAAEIEAWAAIRTVLTYHHTGHCRCAVCKVKRRVRSCD